MVLFSIVFEPMVLKETAGLTTLSRPSQWSFVVPLCLSLSFNLITFIIVSVHLFKAFWTQTKVEKQNLISYLRINITIFTVSGLTWVFEFIAILAGTSWAWYIFIILNSTLGVVIFIFLFTKKVGKLYLSLLHVRTVESTATSTRQKTELKGISKQIHPSSNRNSKSTDDKATCEACDYNKIEAV